MNNLKPHLGVLPCPQVLDKEKKMENTEFFRTLGLFSEIGLEYSTELLSDFNINWYSFPIEWLGFRVIEAAGTFFVFTHEGNFVGAAAEEDRPFYRKPKTAPGA